MERKASPVPAIPIRPVRSAEPFIHRIADLKQDATAQGYGTLAYFLDMAFREAVIQTDQEAEARKLGTVPISEHWLPDQRRADDV